MTDTGRAQNRSRRFGHKVYLSDAEEARMYEFSQVRGVPMGKLMREGALKVDRRNGEGRMSFHVGQKVVCADASVSPQYHWEAIERPIEGQVYTVRKFYVSARGIEGVWLDEISRCELARELWGPQVGYLARRFRPIIERKTSIAIFTRMLTPNELERT